MRNPSLIFELGLKKRLTNGNVPLIARILFKRRKVERNVMQIQQEFIVHWDPVRKRFGANVSPHYNKLISDLQQN